MPPTHLYNTWYRQFEQLRPNERVTRRRLFTWLLIGILKSRSVQLYRVASKIPGEAKEVSITRRLSRFLANPAIRVRQWYHRVAGELIEQMRDTVAEIRLIADGSKVGHSHQLLIVALAYRRRSLPLAWSWVRHPKGHSSARLQIALLAYVKRLIGEGVPVSLVGDSEFGAVEVIKALESWHWQYVVRQKGHHKVLDAEEGWQACADILHAPGQKKWMPEVLLTVQHLYRVNLLAIWKAGEKEPWILATNLPSAKATLDAYKRRMWIEQMFADMKGKGFDLESTHLRHVQRLSCLTLVVALLVVWLCSTGVSVIRMRKRHLVDRADRRDLSIFQIGLRFIERLMKNQVPIVIPLNIGVL